MMKTETRTRNGSNDDDDYVDRDIDIDDIDPPSCIQRRQQQHRHLVPGAVRVGQRGDHHHHDSVDDDTSTSTSSWSLPSTLQRVNSSGDRIPVVLSAYPVVEEDEQEGRRHNNNDEQPQQEIIRTAAEEQIRQELYRAENERQELRRDLQRIHENTIHADSVIHIVGPTTRTTTTTTTTTLGTQDDATLSREEERQDDDEQKTSNEEKQIKYKLEEVGAKSRRIIAVVIAVVAASAVIILIMFRRDDDDDGDVNIVAEPSPPPNASPTLDPTLFVSGSLNGTGECFTERQELYDAVDLYISGNVADIVSVASRYGVPMNVWCIGSITSLSSLFDVQRNINAVNFNEDLYGWDTSNVTDMRYMFHGASQFNGNISTWDVSSVTSMKGMFSSASTFNTDISMWNVSAVLDMSSMFSMAVSFGGGSNSSTNNNLNRWDVSSVITMSSMFQYAKSFHGNNIDTWDVSAVKKMDDMFYGAESMNHNLCIMGSKVPNNTDVSYMFHGTSCPNQFDPDIIFSNPPGPFCYLCLEGVDSAARLSFLFPYDYLQVTSSLLLLWELL